ncbi:unnamed protein product [Rotaria sordida]|uniref:LTD domain-containing protein n=1 Tax=Rotaria sordida TaxID=392033 RepID=A0A814FGX6_9BILA|nr:unnamed protein product [Rotaria sordida]
MSSDSRIVIMDENKKNENIVATYHRRDVQFDSAPSYTSSLVVHLRQLQQDFQTQHQHEKHALNELNERLRHFIDRVQHLEAQNAKYITQIVNFRRARSDFSGADIEWNERYLHLQSDLIAASHGSIDFGLEIEMYQLQTAIYQQLIGLEHEWKDERRSKLEQELNQSSLTLNSVRASNSELGREVESLYAARNDTYQKYLRLTQDWSHMKRQSKEWALNMQLLKNQIAFYKNLRSHSTRGYTSVSAGTFDVKQFWALELDKVIKKIRRDFEELYSMFYRDMTVFYNTQLEEVNKEVEQALRYQSTEVETFTASQQTLQIEYEKVQKTYSYEREVIMQLEATHSKFELEFRSIQQQNDEQLNLQAKDVESLQENLMVIAYNIEEMRRSQKKGSIGIRECPPDGAYISLLNHSSEKTVDISRWVLKRRIDGRTELRYSLPDGIRLQPASELRIYSQQGAAVAKSLKSFRTGTSGRQELVNNEVVSWGVGNSTETFLLNQHGEEKAIFSQSIAATPDNS